MADSPEGKGNDDWAHLLCKLRESGVSESPDEQAEILQRLVHSSLQLENRLSVTEDDVILFVKLLSDWSELYKAQLSSLVTMSTSSAPAILGLTKLLRNLCARVLHNQSRLLSTEVIDIASSLITALTAFTTSHCHTLPSTTTDLHNVVVMTILQLLGNMCAGFPEGQERVWKQLFPEFFRSILNVFEKDEMVCMLLHNCTCAKSSKNRRRDLIESESGIAILSHIVHSRVNESDSEWRSIFMRSFLELVPPSELHRVLVPVQHGLWTALLDTASHIINVGESDESSREKGAWPQWDDSECVNLVRVWGGDVERLISDEAAILMEATQTNSTSSLSSISQLCVSNVRSCLKLMCCLVVMERYRLLFQQQLQLLDSATVLLGKLCVLDGSNNSTKNLSSLKSLEREKERKRADLMFGLKRDLIQLMSGLVYQCPVMQDRVRTQEAIPLILNQCHIDHRNPYIMQWAVLTIRNLCEGNPANQELISQLEIQGVAEATMPQFQPGCEVELTRDGKLRVKSNK